MNEHNRYMLLSEVAAEARVSLSSVRHWLRTGKLPSVRPGRRRLIRRADFEEFLAAGFGDGNELTIEGKGAR
jgi:excisionase family DNA binding protein